MIVESYSYAAQFLGGIFLCLFATTFFEFEIGGYAWRRTRRGIFALLAGIFLAASGVLSFIATFH